MNALATHAGAAALQALLARLGSMAAADLSREDESAGDARDYRAMAATVRADLAANLGHRDAAHAEGYLRALTDLLSIVADGCAPGADWTPIANTERAFARAS